MFSSSYKIDPMEGGTNRRDQLVEIVRSRREASERYTQSFRKRLPQYYDLWRGLTTGSFTPTKNNVWIPLIYSTIWSDVARKIATAYSQWPIVSYAGYGVDDMPIARKQEALVNAQMSDAGVVEKEITTFLGADLYGTATSQVMWDHKEELRNLTYFQSAPLSGEVIRQQMKGTVITFDGPNYRNVDLLDFFPQPGYRTINGNQGMLWCIVRYYLDLDECRFMASQAGGEVFNSKELSRMISDDAVASPRIDDALLRRFEVRQGFTGGKLGVDRFTRPVEIIEMWGKIPSEFADSFGGSTNVVISVANDKYLLRAVDNPFNHRQKPFIAYSPTPDPHYFHAPGKAEVAHQLQVAGNRFINHQLDAADLMVQPMWMYNRMMGISTKNLWAAPGRIFGVDGPPGESLVPVPMNFGSLQVGGEMTRTMWSFIQMGSGVQEDTIMGMASGSDRQTAREFMGRREASGTRLMLESVLYDQNYLEPLANMFTAMNLQFLDTPREVLVLGDAAMNDPVTGEPIVDTRVQIDGSVLNHQYAAKANGTTMYMSRESEKANMLTMFQVLAGAGPALAGSFNMVNFLRQMLRTMGFKNVNEIIQKAPSMEEMLGQQGQTAGSMPSDIEGMLQLVGGGAPSGPITGVMGG